MNFKKLSIVGLSVVIISIMIFLSSGVFAQDVNNKLSIEDQQGPNSISNNTDIENGKKSQSKAEKTDESITEANEETSSEATSDERGTREIDKENSAVSAKEKDEQKSFIGPVQPRIYGELTEGQRTFNGEANIIFQYKDGERVRGLQIQGAFSKGSTTSEDDVENKQIASWDTIPFATIPFENKTAGDSGEYSISFPSTVLSRPNVIIPTTGDSPDPGDILNYGEVARLNQIKIINLPNEGYTMSLSGLQYHIQTRADYRYNPETLMTTSFIENGSNNELSFSWNSSENSFVSDINGSGTVRLPWQLYQPDNPENAYFPVWTTAIRNFPVKDYPEETAPKASLVLIYGIQDGAVTVTLKNDLYIERYVNKSGEKIPVPPGRLQDNKVGAADGFKYSCDFPKEYDWGNLTYVYQGWHSTFYKRSDDIPGGLKSGTPNIVSTYKGGKPINGVYKLTARVYEQYIDTNGNEFGASKLNQTTDFDNYSDNPRFDGNPEKRMTIGNSQYIYKGYIYDKEDLSQLKTGNPSFIVNRSRKVKYVYEKFEPKLEIKKVPAEKSFDGVLEKGKIIIPTPSLGSCQISVTNTLGTNNGWDLYAELEWQGDGIGSASKIVTTSSGNIGKMDIFGTTTSVPVGVVNSEKNLTIGTTPIVIMTGKSGGDPYEGIYTTDLGIMSLEIDDGSKVSAKSYSGSINWNLASVP